MIRAALLAENERNGVVMTITCGKLAPCFKQNSIL
jgi:hypothetical protein